MGPLAGVNGGKIVAEGSLKQIMASKESLTGRMLAEPLRHPMPDVRNQALRQMQDKEQLHVEGADLNNLRSVNVSVPLRQMVADRKSTRLNSSHVAISYAVFC